MLTKEEQGELNFLNKMAKHGFGFVYPETKERYLELLKKKEEGK